MYYLIILLVIWVAVFMLNPPVKMLLRALYRILYNWAKSPTDTIIVIHCKKDMHPRQALKEAIETE